MGQDRANVSGQGRRATADILPLIVILGIFLILAGVYLSGPGLAWDEALDVPFAEEKLRWFEGLPATGSWDAFYGSVGRLTSHPPLFQYEMAVTIKLFGDSVGTLFAARIAAVLSMAVLLAAVYFFTLRTIGRMAAVAAALFLLAIPQVFEHSVLATFDAPISLWWFAAAALFYAAMHNRRLAWAAGLAAALAFLTKINAVALPLVLWPWGLFYFGRRALPAIIWTAVLVPTLFFALYPAMWPEPFVGVGKYLGDKFDFVVALYAAVGVDLKTSGDAVHRMLQRADIPVLYFGHVYAKAPWHYAIVMTVVTTPVAVLAWASAGVVTLLRHRKQTLECSVEGSEGHTPAHARQATENLGTDTNCACDKASRWQTGMSAPPIRVSPRTPDTSGEVTLLPFLAWNIIFWLAAFTIGLSKPYDGARLFAVVFPFVAIVAGAGTSAAWEYFPRTAAGRGLFAVAAIATLASLGLAFFPIAPFGMSYYNSIVGGLPGAAERGLPVTYWGETIDNEITSRINAAAGEGARVAAFPMDSIYVENQRFFGLLRPDIRNVSIEDDWDYLVIANRGDALASRPDVGALTVDAIVTRKIQGVPAAWLVEKKR